MPKREDIESILLIGSGPIVIGQACEFDYSGTQACKALREEGYRVILVNSNPATIMTDPETADRTYVEPLTPEVLEQIIARERPDALLPTIGGQTGLNLALELAKRGVLERYDVELIGASLGAIRKAEDREAFKAAMERIGLRVTRSGYARTRDEAYQVIADEELSFPIILRPSYTLGGFGGNVAYNAEELEAAIRWGLDASPASEILVEESIIGWKEYELEVMRDRADNCVIVCSIENLDAMGVHTGDSITVAPAQTLSDREYQRMRDAALAIMREIGVDTGGSNVQFAVNPDDGRMIVVEMNPRVSRSSALASKATGFPIAKIAARLAVGYTLDEIRNDITGCTPACFEPTIDYVVTKIPRFTFEKFPETPAVLTTQMKSVGEVMAIGRTFRESLQKAMRSLETGRSGFDPQRPVPESEAATQELLHDLRVPNPDRLWAIGDGFRAGLSVADLHELTGIDPWFLHHIQHLITMEGEIARAEAPDAETMRQWKREGFADARLAALRGVTEAEVRELRHGLGVRPVMKRVDTCAAEFEALTPYLYSSYEGECEADPTDAQKVVILGSGPNRIGQGIEFDYCCVHGALALSEAGFETIMVNCNPETVSTDYDTSDRLYFEPLTLEDVLEVLHIEKPKGVILQFGGQTPLKLATALDALGVPVLGTPTDAIDRAEDRERFGALVQKLGLRQPRNGLARTEDEALRIAQAIGFPIIVRPSYVLGGRAMEIVYTLEDMARYMRQAVQVSPDHPVLIDEFLEDAVELDVDALADGTDVVIAGVMQHIEEAGVHSGDSACALPPHDLPEPVLDVVRDETVAMARELGVVGLMNVQFAVRGRTVYVLEVNPRASRTVPFVSKATGVPIAKLAARVMAGATLKELGFTKEVVPKHVSVKEVVFPFNRFPGNDTLLGPEMKSTGEVMGVDRNFARAYGKAQAACGFALPGPGRVFISVKEPDKALILGAARKLVEAGYELVCTRGTAAYLAGRGVPSDVVNKVTQGRPHIVDRIKSNEIALVINTTIGRQSILDSRDIRRSAYVQGIPYMTTVPGAWAAVAAMVSRLEDPTPHITTLQELYEQR
ncbi:MAG: carbamoyl-phosphate synthase large subunit [Deltaproteobacteria bacterium]|nr:carbamoyl-phosphate synthase large subunit [Deltaproteobacteria bacterium]MCB9786459.1 carbamoyl-phosphate synthase large subunit [Deltaproteobacteria bacterium]